MTLHGVLCESSHNIIKQSFAVEGPGLCFLHICMDDMGR